MKYLRGSDGKTAEASSIRDSVYLDEVDPNRYNVTPVRVLAKVRLVGEKKDTTFEYVNPFSGGAALLVSGPGPVIIPDCTVKFADQAGNTYEKTSDSNGYIYLERSELPDYTTGNPSVTNLAARTKPVSFSFGSNTVTDQDKIARTCGVPYKVDLAISMTGSSWERTEVTADYSLTRTVEGSAEACVSRKETLPQVWVISTTGSAATCRHSSGTEPTRKDCPLRRCMQETISCC